ncbi:hypothetical protein VPNG_07285 [Cytospora leucostoma]|uniref:Uncharacterized protein n=1 Tax=Cytospora leucostoma TaxID=1230097 RepID=A0A423WKK1_9PEZI|nr:hypothetical protein VPNG_07285 [Cytospora leucostoma]
MLRPPPETFSTAARCGNQPEKAPTCSSCVDTFDAAHLEHREEFCCASEAQDAANNEMLSTYTGAAGTSHKTSRRPSMRTSEIHRHNFHPTTTTGSSSPKESATGAGPSGRIRRPSGPVQKLFTLMVMTLITNILTATCSSAGDAAAARDCHTPVAGTMADPDVAFWVNVKSGLVVGVASAAFLGILGPGGLVCHLWKRWRWVRRLEQAQAPRGPEAWP